jgi:hypothetical protein
VSKKPSSFLACKNILHKPVNRELMFLLKTALAIIVIFLVCELFIFNMDHYVTFWGDDPIDMLSAEAYLYNMTYDKERGLLIPSGNAETPAAIEFRNINKRIVTVYIDAVFDENTNKQSFYINYSNRGHSNRNTAAFDVISGVEETKYVTLQTSGNVGQIRVVYTNSNPATSIRNIILNKPVPLKIFWPRLFLFSTAAFCIVMIKHKKLFSLSLRSNSKWQNILTAGIILAFTIYLFLLMLFTMPFSLKQPFIENFADEPEDQYNAYLVDAILAGHTYLNIEPDEALLALENPYDNGLARLWAGENFLWDHVLFDEKYYSYFGIVQVLILSLPYKLITGHYISTRIAVFIFSALAGIFLVLLWRRLVFRYMKSMPLGMYLLGMVSVTMCSMLSFHVSKPKFYEVAGSSALFFTTLGLWLILGSMEKDKIRKATLTLGSLCMALAVGCRPNYMFFLVFIPIILLDDLKEAWKDKRQFLGMCVCIALPCMFVAAWQMWYNYIRFGSILEFGSNYQLTVSYYKKLGLISPIGTISKILVGIFVYLFSAFRIEASFPFVYLAFVRIDVAFKGYLYNWFCMGTLTIPVMWFLFGIKTVSKTIEKQQRPLFRLIVAMMCVGFVQIVISAATFGGIHTRYELDFFWLFVLGGLVCACFITERVAEFQRMAINRPGEKTLDLHAAMQSIICICMVLSIILFFLTTLSSNESNLFRQNNPAVFYSIQRLLGFGLR